MNQNTENIEGKKIENKDNEWRRLRMIEAGEVNGVRFPPGIIIDVNAADGEKLVESKRAEYVDNTKTDDIETQNNEKITNNSDDKEDSEASKSKASEDNNEAPSDSGENDVSKTETEDNLADELKDLSETISSEAENEKK